MGTEPLRVETEGGIATAVIDHPELNLLDLPLMLAFDEFGRHVAADDDVRVVVVRSADPEFFIAHADVNLILGLPRSGETEGEGLGLFHTMVERFRTMPKVTIGVLDGIARGGGAELFSAFDLRFVTPRSTLGQPEVALGLIPGGGGTQRLGQLVGRSRAIEIVTGGADVDGPTAAAWGWATRCLAGEDLDAHVGDLARRIVAAPAGAVAAAKASIDAGLVDPVPGLIEEGAVFARRLTDADAIALMERFLELGGQTREAELDLPGLLAKLVS